MRAQRKYSLWRLTQLKFTTLKLTLSVSIKRQTLRSLVPMMGSLRSLTSTHVFLSLFRITRQDIQKS